MTDCITYLGGCAHASDCDTSAVLRLALSQPLDPEASTVCGRVEIVQANAPDYDPVNQDWGTVCHLNHLADANTWDDNDARVRTKDATGLSLCYSVPACSKSCTYTGQMPRRYHTKTSTHHCVVHACRLCVDSSALEVALPLALSRCCSNLK